MCDFAYPSIPYLKDMKDYNPKKVGRLIVEEKFDGANIGISFDSDGNISVQNRGGFLLEYTGQFSELDKWLDVYEGELFDLFEDKYIVFGEWMAVKHNVHYNDLWSYFIIFDIYDKNRKKFLSVRKRNEMLFHSSFIHTPDYTVKDYYLDTFECLTHGESHFGNERMEGLVIRKDRNNFNVWKAKVVRENFIQPDAQHWKKNKIVKNLLHYR